MCERRREKIEAMPPPCRLNENASGATAVAHVIVDLDFCRAQKKGLAYSFCNRLASFSRKCTAAAESVEGPFVDFVQNFIPVIRNVRCGCFVHFIFFGEFILLLVTWSLCYRFDVCRLDC